MKKKPLILFGTQTGTAEDLAEQLAEQLKNKGVKSRLENMFDVDLKVLQEHKDIFVIVSTWGEGEPPDDGEDLYLEVSKAANGYLSNSRFAVFGLGDTGYEFFCKCGVDFDRYLSAAGAKRLLERVDADIDFEDDFDKWSVNVSMTITENAHQFS